MQQPLLKRMQNNYLQQMNKCKKKLMKSVFAALGNIQATEQNRPSTKKSSPAECQHQSAHAKELLHSAKLHWLPTIEKYPC